MRADVTFQPYRPVVLLHAFPLNRRMWDGQVAALAGAGFSPLALDFPGFGAAPLHPGRRSLADFARAVLEALDELHVGSAAFVGLSMGGYVLFRLIELAPERVAAMVLADTRAEADGPEARTRRADQAARVAAGGPEALADGFLESALSLATRRSRPDVVAKVRELVGQASAAGIVHALRAMAERPDSSGLLASVKVPALVIVGEHDALTPPGVARQLVERLPHGRLVVLPGAGHLSNLEAPEAFNEALLAFLRGL